MRLTGPVAGLISLFWLCGCGGSSVSNPPPPQFTIASGNWSVSGSPPSLFFTGGFLTQNGTAVSGTLHLIALPCLDPFADDLVVTGTISGNNLSITTAPVNGEMLTLSLHPSAGQSGTIAAMEGSASLSGSCATSSAVTATLIPLITGVFAGSFTFGLSGDLSANLTQSGPDAHGFFHVSGTLSLNGSSCFTSATVTDSTIFGGDVIINMDTDTGQAFIAAGVLVTQTAPEQLTSILAIQSGPCANQTGLVFLKKQ